MAEFTDLLSPTISVFFFAISSVLLFRGTVFLRLQFEQTLHRLRRALLAGNVQMCIDICCGAEVAVAEPFLNLLHHHAMLQQQRGAAVAQIMETNVPQRIDLQNTAEAVGEIGRLDAFTQLIDADISVVFLVPGTAADLPILILLCLQTKQHFPYRRYKRQTALAGAGLRGIGCNDGILAVN